MRREQAEELLRLLRRNYATTKFNEDADEVDAYWLGLLRPLDHTVGEKAVQGLTARVKRWPTRADLNEQVAIVREQLGRERRDAERRDAEEAYENMPRIPLREIPAAEQILQWITESPVPLESADDGPCEDRCGRMGVRYVLGRFRVCAACARRRLNAAAKSGRAA